MNNIIFIYLGNWFCLHFL